MSSTSLRKTDLPLQIGITGGIGSGKSLVCHIFNILGIPVFEADKVARELYDENVSLKEKLICLFGPDLYGNNGHIDRAMLASLIFGDKSALQAVNQLVHPLVHDAFKRWHLQQNSTYVLYEAAILFESGFSRMMDANILVTAPEELRIQRVMERDGLTREQITKRMQHQWEEDKKIKLADLIITNDENELVIPQIIETDKKIRTYGKIC